MHAQPVLSMPTKMDGVGVPGLRFAVSTRKPGHSFEGVLGPGSVKTASRTAPFAKLAEAPALVKSNGAPFKFSFLGHHFKRNVPSASISVALNGAM